MHMGLFDFRKKPKPDMQAESAKIESLQFDNMKFHFPASDDEPALQWSMFVNMSEKQLNADDGELIKNVRLKADGNRITGTKGNRTVFDIDKRSKTFKELETFAGHTAEAVSIKKKEGQYGTFYKVRITFRIVVE